MEAQSGDANAFQKLVSLHDERIMTLAFQLTRNQQDAEDLYQEVFIKAYRHLNNFHFKSEFYTWLYRITVNTFYNLNRKLSKFKYQENDGITDSIINQIPDDRENPGKRREIMSAVKTAAMQLPVKQKTVFMLKHLQGLKIREIAKIMDIGEGTVKKYLFRAMEKLRQDLQEYHYA